MIRLRFACACSSAVLAVAARRAVALLLLTFPVVAADPERELEAKFRELDADHDGKLTATESAPYREWLAGADANGDGFFSFDEVRGELVRKLGRTVRGEVDRAKPELVAPIGQGPPVIEPEKQRVEEARSIPPAEAGIGRRLGDFEVQRADGTKSPLVSMAGPRGLVVALVSPTCPVGRRYFPELDRLSSAYGSRGFGFAFVRVEDEGDDGGFAGTPLAGRVVREPTGRLVRSLQASTTTETFLFDAARTLVYRGAVDDRYGVGYSRDEAKQTFLKDAIEAVLAERSAALAATTAPGCALVRSTADESSSEEAVVPITYHNRISRLLDMHCVECHRGGGIAPFPLQTYAQVSAKAGMIRRMVGDDLMPPWFAAPPPAGHRSPWANDRRLARADKRELLDWLATGRPEGDSREAPLARTWPHEWAIGTPDAVIQIPAPIEVKAEGTMPYQNVTVPTGVTEDKWVQAWEVQPTAREVVHHVLVFMREAPVPGKRQVGNDDDDDGFFAAFVPGNSHKEYSAQLGKRLPAGSTLRFQIHYTPNGKATRDQVRVGLRFSAQPPEHIVEVKGIAQPRLKIPPGASHHPETSSVPVPVEIKVLSLMPHMHLRGQAFRFETVLPSGEARTLLEVPRYDFNWQLGYRFAEPLTLPAGSRIRATGWFDNSFTNPANPDPSREVHWGRQTYDEMMLGYVEYYIPSRRTTAAR
jgi:hypothetical protein